MSKIGDIIETKITQFNRGITPDTRSRDAFECQLCRNFDNYSYKSKLVPYKDFEDAGWASQADTQLQTFLLYGNSIYGLGIITGSGKANLALNTNAAEPSWSSPTNGADSSGTTGFNLFKEYNGILYGSVPSASAGRIWSYNIAGTTFTSSAQALNHLTITQGLIHSANDILFIAYATATAAYVMSKNGAGAFNTTHLTLPARFVPTDLAEDGLYLVISGIMPDGRFMSYFWDMSSTSWDDTKTITWGEGTYINTSNPNNFILEKIDGYLISVALEGSVSPKLVFRKSYGGLQIKIKEIYIATGVNAIIGKQKYNNRLFFGLNATSFGGTTYDYTGMWSVGGNGEGGFSVNLDRLPKNNTLVNQIRGFIIAQDYFYVSYLTVGSVYELTKTNDQVSYTASSIYETIKFNAGDSSLKKDLIGVALSCEPLPAAGQLVLKWKTDDDTTWSDAVFTLTTDNLISESISGASGLLPKDYREIWWQIISTGNAQPTELTFEEVITGKRKYS